MGGGARIAQGCVPVAITVGFVSPDGALVKSLPRQKTFHSHAFLLQSPAHSIACCRNKRRTTLETLPHWAGHSDHDYVTFPSCLHVRVMPHSLWHAGAKRYILSHTSTTKGGVCE